MADKPTTKDVGSGSQYNASVINDNFAILENAIEDCVGRGGTSESPNSMSGDLDMNNNKVSNVADPTDDGDVVTKGWVTSNLSAGAASASAEAAAASAASAAGDAADAAISLASMDQVYLGGFATAPTEDNNGGTLISGATYYDTTVNALYTWDGSSWSQLGSAVEGVIVTNNYTGTATSTAIVVDYNVGQILVFVAGAFISPAATDGVYYTATDGNNITVYGTLAGDDITVQRFGNFVSADFYQKSETYTQAEVDALLQNTAITGEVRMAALPTAPTGWLVCDGSAVSRTTYATLFSAIGTGFGVGDGSTTFNLPDFQGRAPVGVGTGDATNASAWTLGEKQGDETHTLTDAQMPSHNHSGSTGSDSHSHSITVYGSGDTTPYKVGRGWSNGSTATVSNATASDSHSHSVSIGTAGSDSAHNNLQPSLGINFIIKT